MTSQNLKINLDEPEDQLAATELIVELLQVNSDLATRVIGGPNPVTGTYTIYSNLCLSADACARGLKHRYHEIFHQR